MSNFRENMINIAKDTIAISEQGEYTLGRMLFKLDNKSETKLFEPKDFDKIAKTIKEQKQKHNFIILYRPESTLKTIYRYRDIRPSTRLGVLNFASAYHAGGGFLNGAMAQEESLAYCSNLYRKQTTGEGKLFYIKNEKEHNAFYTDNMLMSNVTFFKNDKYQLVYPFVCQVLTSPAVNVTLAKNKGFSDESIEVAMKNRMRKILQLFVYSNCDTIILGAFGCGVFGNQPETVARLWNELIYDEDLGSYFRLIIFSIYDRNGSNNYETFFNMRNQE